VVELYVIRFGEIVYRAECSLNADCSHNVNDSIDRFSIQLTMVKPINAALILLRIAAAALDKEAAGLVACLVVTQSSGTSLLVSLTFCHHVHLSNAMVVGLARLRLSRYLSVDGWCGMVYQPIDKRVLVYRVAMITSNCKLNQCCIARAFAIHRCSNFEARLSRRKAALSSTIPCGAVYSERNVAYTTSYLSGLRPSFSRCWFQYSSEPSSGAAPLD
jgi:hypothetical protein